ncbi:ornithine carbamoyltransferase [Betaproteobacteria bacterium]|nr:ornithine carbamoyltransferase [Betaproteobacteria bacterium]
MNKIIRHFLRVSDLSFNEIQNLFERSALLKKQVDQKIFEQQLQNRTLILLFEKHSTRTRLSFEVGMQQLGGNSIVLQMRDTQIDRGETIEDAARVISRMCDIIMVRTFEHSKIEAFAKNSMAPIINGLTNEHHPCQVLSDIFTFQEHRGNILGKTVSWIGDINNMCASWIEASNIFGFKLHVSSPPQYMHLLEELNINQNNVEYFSDPLEACVQSNLITTDVWTSMGFEKEKKERLKTFECWTVDKRKIDVANKDVVFMHCLPAHRGEEVSAEVIDGPQSVVWQEAENRLHFQKALLEFLIKINEG